MATLKSLRARSNPLMESSRQLELLNRSSPRVEGLPKFDQKIRSTKGESLRPASTEILQINIGKMCNQVCKHCHVDAGPDRKEIMTRETLEQCLEALRKSTIAKVDITGGAPEMNPHFRWFVEEVSKLGREAIVRCNLTIILANPKYNDLPQFFAQHRVHVISSLPYYSSAQTDRQRGDGVFDKSIRALQMLNEVGYGKEGSGLKLDLVYNPVGAFLPAPQKGLEADFKRELKKLFNIEFNSLFAITNMPVSRFLEYLIESENFDEYMERLVTAFNPATIDGVMCRNTLSVGWDGKLYDCDFNQMLDLKLSSKVQHIRDYSPEAVAERKIIVNQHCFGCTAGAGSSCGGEVV